MWFHWMALSIVEVPDLRIIEVGHLSMCVPAAAFSMAAIHSAVAFVAPCCVCMRQRSTLHASMLLFSHVYSPFPFPSPCPIGPRESTSFDRSFVSRFVWFVSRSDALCTPFLASTLCWKAFHQVCFAGSNRKWYVRVCVFPTHPRCFSFILSSDHPRRFAHLSSSCAVTRVLQLPSWSSPILRPFRHVHGRQGGPRPVFPCVRSLVRQRPSNRTSRSAASPCDASCFRPCRRDDEAHHDVCTNGHRRCTTRTKERKHNQGEKLNVSNLEDKPTQSWRPMQMKEWRHVPVQEQEDKTDKHNVSRWGLQSILRLW